MGAGSRPEAGADRPQGAGAGRSIGRALGWVVLSLPLPMAVLFPLGLVLVAPATPIAAGLGARADPSSRPGWGPGWLAYGAGALPLLLNPWSLIPLCAPSDLTALHASLAVAAAVLVAGSFGAGLVGSARAWVTSAALYAVTFAVIYTIGGGLEVEMVC